MLAASGCGTAAAGPCRCRHLRPLHLILLQGRVGFGFRDHGVERRHLVLGVGVGVVHQRHERLHFVVGGRALQFRGHRGDGFGAHDLVVAFGRLGELRIGQPRTVANPLGPRLRETGTRARTNADALGPQQVPRFLQVRDGRLGVEARILQLVARLHFRGARRGSFVNDGVAGLLVISPRANARSALTTSRSVGRAAAIFLCGCGSLVVQPLLGRLRCGERIRLSCRDFVGADLLLRRCFRRFEPRRLHRRLIGLARKRRVHRRLIGRAAGRVAFLRGLQAQVLAALRASPAASARGGTPPAASASASPFPGRRC